MTSLSPVMGPSGMTAVVVLNVFSGIAIYQPSRARMYGVRIAYSDLSKVSPSIRPACLRIVSSAPILKSPSWSVLVNTTKQSRLDSVQ